MKNRIKECRQTAGMTLDDLAEATGEKRSSISYWERNMPPVAKVEKLAKALHVSPAYLVGWTDAK